MHKHRAAGRREFLINITAWSATGLPFLAHALKSPGASAAVSDLIRGMTASGAGSSVAPAPYDPAATYEITATEMEFRRNQAGRMLMARIYRPNGNGPFPVVLDLHGGAWNAKDRLAEEPMDRALARSGLLVVAIDL